ncbi:MAG: RtcB family protein [Planctomycetes bacterium]|nr:RtcB family protein [Planctomycetota bacterium]
MSDVSASWPEKLRVEPIDAVRWRVPRQGPMRTEGLIFASGKLIEDIQDDPCVQQVANVATLPGIVGKALAMPDLHWGYGFPIGGVAAFDLEEGVISPGGVGYDINCGVRLLRTDIEAKSVTGKKSVHLRRLAGELEALVPTGVGRGSKDLRLGPQPIRGVLERGAAWAVDAGYGVGADLQHLEAGGALAGADPDAVSRVALDRGRDQLGSLGSGNHFLEVQVVDEIFDELAAEAMGLRLGCLSVLIHTGSRGLGYQVCDDFLHEMLLASKRYGIELPDRQLCCAPIRSPEAQRYLRAMNAAANFAFANRQVITARVRDAFTLALDLSDASASIGVVYDVCHNIAKIEEHAIDGVQRKLCVHRKGATRAFAPGHAELPAAYRATGQPVLVPGDMGRYSFVLAGQPGAMQESFGSCCHGAGRVLSRHAARKLAGKRNLISELKGQGIEVRAASRGTVAEEMPEAYKDVAEVVRTVVDAGLAKLVARLRPIAVVKG